MPFGYLSGTIAGIMTALNTKANDCKAGMGWHEVCLSKRQRRTQMKIDTDPHYCYDLQVWIVKGIILDCNHPESMKLDDCCNAHNYAGERHSCLSDH